MSMTPLQKSKRSQCNAKSPVIFGIGHLTLHKNIIRYMVTAQLSKMLRLRFAILCQYLQIMFSRFILNEAIIVVLFMSKRRRLISMQLVMKPHIRLIHIFLPSTYHRLQIQIIFRFFFLIQPFIISFSNQEKTFLLYAYLPTVADHLNVICEKTD